MIAEATRVAAEGRQDLSADQVDAAVTAILEERVSPIQAATFLAVLRAKGEAVDEIFGCARAMLRRAARVDLGGMEAIDVGGTGGDRSGSFNISTAAALVAAAAGARVLKHGNRRVTSRTGSADFIEALGAPPRADVDMEFVRAAMAQVGFAYLYTPSVHRFPEYLTALRREMGVRSIFNLAGPAAHPAPIRGQILGVAQAHLTVALAEALHRIGRPRAFVVHGLDGLDEFSPVGSTKVSELRNGEIKTYFVEPEDFGLPRARMDDIQGGSPDENAAICRRVFDGERGPYRNAILMTAGPALVVAGIATDLRGGVDLAAQAIDAGRARRTLDRFVALHVDQEPAHAG